MTYEPITLEKELALRLGRVLSSLSNSLRGQQVLHGGMDALQRIGAPDTVLDQMSKEGAEIMEEALLTAIRKVYPDGVEGLYLDTARLLEKILEEDPMLATQFTAETGMTVKELEDSIQESVNGP